MALLCHANGWRACSYDYWRFDFAEWYWNIHTDWTCLTVVLLLSVFLVLVCCNWLNFSDCFCPPVCTFLTDFPPPSWTFYFPFCFPPDWTFLPFFFFQRTSLFWLICFYCLNVYYCICFPYWVHMSYCFRPTECTFRTVVFTGWTFLTAPLPLPTDLIFLTVLPFFTDWIFLTACFLGATLTWLWSTLHATIRMPP